MLYSVLIHYFILKLICLKNIFPDIYFLVFLFVYLKKIKIWYIVYFFFNFLHTHLGMAKASKRDHGLFILSFLFPSGSHSNAELLCCKTLLEMSTPAIGNIVIFRLYDRSQISLPFHVHILCQFISSLRFHYTIYIVCTIQQYNIILCIIRPSHK